MTEDLDTFLSDLHRLAEAVRIEGRYQQAALMIEAALHIERLRRSTKPATDERKERFKEIDQQIEALRYEAETHRRELEDVEYHINKLDAQRWALILTP